MYRLLFYVSCCWKVIVFWAYFGRLRYRFCFEFWCFEGIRLLVFRAGVDVRCYILYYYYYTYTYYILLYIILYSSFYSFPIYHLFLFSSFLFLPFPLFLISHSFYTCRHLDILIYVPSVSGCVLSSGFGVMFYEFWCFADIPVF